MIPAGNISLEEAIALYIEQCGGDAPEWDPEVSDKESQERWWIEHAASRQRLQRAFAQAFLEGTLVALVFDPRHNREFEITRPQWHKLVEQSFWDVTLLSGPIVFNAGPELASYRGLTPYLRRDVFSAWLRSVGGDLSEQGPPRLWKRVGQPAVDEWYLKWVTGGASEWLKRNGSGLLTPTEREDFLAARAAFGDKVTRDMTRDARRKLALAEWKQRGRKPENKFAADFSPRN